MRSPLLVAGPLLAVALSSAVPCQRAPVVDPPPGAVVLLDGEGRLATAPRLSDFELHLEFALPDGADGGVAIGDVAEVVLSARGCGGLRGVGMPLAEAGRPAGAWQVLELRVRQDRGRPAVISGWLNGTQVLEDVVVPGSAARPALEGLRREWPAAETPDLSDGGFAFLARFRSRGEGTLVGKAPAGSTRWAPHGKTLFLRGGQLVYDVGWVGSLTSRSRFDDGDEHTAVLTHDGRTALLFVDGELEGERDDLVSADADGHVLKVGATSSNFASGLVRGEVLEVRVFDAPLARGVAAAMSGGAPADVMPRVRWESGDDGDSDTGDAVRHAISLRAGDPAVRFANVWTRPLADLDHRRLIAGLDAAAFERGGATYRSVCAACHGLDGETVTLPTARPFSTAALLNGSEPHRIFETLTRGFRTMPPQTWMTPAQRYDVIHYVRERFLRTRNTSQYVRVTPEYLAALPTPRPRYPDLAVAADGLGFRDFGPGLVAQVGGGVPVGIAVQLPNEVTIAYDLHRMASVGAWRGEFLDVSNTQHHLQRGEGIATPGATPWAWSTEWGPVVDDTEKPPRGPVPAVRRIGHQVHGRELVLSYAVDGRAVLESPTSVTVGEQVALVHRFRVAAGRQPIAWRWTDRAAAGDGATAGAAGRDGERAIGVRGDAAVRVFGGRIRVPAAERDLVFAVIRGVAASDTEHDAFRAWVDHAGDGLVADPAELAGGGAALWPDVLTTRGALGAGAGAYVVDTLSLPDVAPVGAWLRTSALDFFSDGRAAVCTLGGDVWIVDGIDADLDQLRWKRFAAGLFEPLGLLVVDDVVHVTTRDGLIRLRDLDGNGEADSYECVYADVDVTPSFHAFNFDLQRAPSGELCYVKSGRYTQFSLPGAVVAVDPLRGTARYVATGFRTPNGMGVLADGALTVSDNQGNWVPASKISRIVEGGFYGVFQSDARERDDFDRPFLWLPQEVDSSSGGQLWLGDARFGPLAGRLLHTSFGKGWAYAVTLQELDGVVQASCVTLPFQFAAGVQRARIDPVDGQVYLVGLSGWQGPPDGADGCLQRLRWTGRDETFLIGSRVIDGGVELEFTGRLAAGAAAPGLYAVERWNYRWDARYGSAHWSVRQPDREGQDRLPVAAASLTDGGRRVRLEIPTLTPCDQLRIACEVPTASGTSVRGTVHATVHRLR